jgi:solute carrier family 25 carnitine/acylcarnitine transporter 20/29
MSADFWAGYISGAVSIILGNPLDVLKVRLQAGGSTPSPSSASHAATTPPSSTRRPPIPSITPPPTITTTTTASYLRPFLLGTAAPVLGYGALNALLFVSYNRTEAFLNQHILPPSSSPSGTGGDGDQQRGTNLTTTWLAGAVGGLATWVVSTPTELVKCRAQLQIPAGAGAGAGGGGGGGGAGAGGVRTAAGNSASSLAIAKSILRTSGLRGLYFGGGVTALRDSIGYGFYFWGYELCSRWMHQLFPSAPSSSQTQGGGVLGTDAARVLLCGGMAGVITWASVFPLDVIKTRVQTQVFDGMGMGERAALLGGGAKRRLGAWDVARETYREGGVRPFFRGLVVCSVRAFIVNAVQWAVYEWIMMELGQGRRRREEVEVVGVVSG